MTKQKQTFLILDGNALLHRAWHAIPPLKSPDGRVVNAAYGFTNIIEKMREDIDPDYMAVGWDLPGVTFRHEEFKEYKATREKKEEELYAQIEVIRDILAGYGVPSLSKEAMEADDVIGALAKQYGPENEDVKVLILTGDLDALQLVQKDVDVVVFKKGLSETKTYDRAAVKERYGLEPEQLIDYKALVGDTSDNIPGIKGVGKKTAAKLLAEFGTIEEIYKAMEQGKVPEKFAKKLRGKEEEVEQMKRLVTIVDDLDLDFSLKEAKLEEPDAAALAELFRTLGFRRLLKRYAPEGAGAPAAVKAGEDVKDVDSIKKLKTGVWCVSFIDGEQNLFGSALKELRVFDGEKSVVLKNPEKKQVQAVQKALNKQKKVIGHDLKALMWHIGAITTDVFDVQVAAYLLQPGSRSLDLPAIVFKELKKTIKASANTLVRVQLIREAAEKLTERLKDEHMPDLAEYMEMPLIRILFEMERAGIAVDQKHLENLSETFGEKIEVLENKIHKPAGREFNVNSPLQLAEVLYKDLGLPTKGIKKTKSGFSTAASELEKLWEKHEIIPLISQYRELAKLKSTYIDTLPDLVREDGRIHTTYNQTVTATGRLSSSDPNLQNIPIRTQLGNEIRKAFVAPKGKVLLAADYSQIELRIAAVLAKDRSFIRAFKDGADIHSRTAAEILNKKEDEVTKEERRAAKAINFGILYGMGSRNLARSTGLSKDEAKTFIDKYFAVHPGISEYIETMKALAHEQGYVETIFGRRRYLPDIHSGVHMLKAAAERMAMNMPIQGANADLMKIAMVNVDAWLAKTNLDIKMLLQVHDELVFEVVQSDVDAAAENIKDIMEGVHEFEIPLEVDVETGKNWGELKSWEA